MVAWNKAQESGLQTETFMLLLHKLGFHLATDVGKCFPRIPHFWSADHLYQLALKVGPIKKEDLKMDLSVLETASTVTSSSDQQSTDLVPTEPAAGSSKMSVDDPMMMMTSVASPSSSSQSTKAGGAGGSGSLSDSGDIMSPGLSSSDIMGSTSMMSASPSDFSSFAM